MAEACTVNDFKPKVALAIPQSVNINNALAILARRMLKALPRTASKGTGPGYPPAWGRSRAPD